MEYGDGNCHRNIQLAGCLGKNPWHPLLFSIILVSAYPLWRFRKYLIEAKVFYGLYALAGIFFFLVNEQFINNFLNLFTVLGGGFILWRLRKQLTPVTTIYGFCGIGLLLASGVRSHSAVLLMVLCL